MYLVERQEVGMNVKWFHELTNFNHQNLWLTYLVIIFELLELVGNSNGAK